MAKRKGGKTVSIEAQFHCQSLESLPTALFELFSPAAAANEKRKAFQTKFKLNPNDAIDVRLASL